MRASPSWRRSRRRIRAGAAALQQLIKSEVDRWSTIVKEVKLELQ